MISDPKDPVDAPEGDEAEEHTDPVPAEGGDPPPAQDVRTASKAASKVRREFRDRMIHESREVKPASNPGGYQTR